MMPLLLLSPGEQGQIAEIRLRTTCHGAHGDRTPSHVHTHFHARAGREGSVVRVEAMGLRVGRCVEVLQNGGGPVLLRLDESRIAVDRSLAMRIMVRRTA